MAVVGNASHYPAASMISVPDPSKSAISALPPTPTAAIDTNLPRLAQAPGEDLAVDDGRQRRTFGYAASGPRR